MEISERLGRTAGRLAVIAIAIPLVLSACGGSVPGEGPLKPGTQGSTSEGSTSASNAPAGGDLAGSVEMWVYPVFADEGKHRAFWDDKISRFQEQNSGVKVTYEIFPWANRDEAIQTALAGGVAPDLIYLIPDQLSTYADSIQPIDGYIPADQLDDLQESVRRPLTTDAGMLGAPLLISSDPLICNQAVFDEVGAEMPSTWDDMRALAPKFAAANKDLLAYWGSPEVSLNASFYPLLWQAGGQVFTDNGDDVAFNSAEGVAALSFLLELKAAGVLEEDALASHPPLEQSGIGRGDTGCQYGAYQAPLFEGLWDSQDIVVLPQLKGQTRAGYGTIGTLAMFEDSDSKEAAGAFAAFVTSPDVVKEYVMSTGYFSPYTSASDLYEEGSLNAKTQETVEFASVGQLHPSARQVMGILSSEIQAALLDGKDPKQALDDAAAAARGIL